MGRGSNTLHNALAVFFDRRGVPQTKTSATETAFPPGIKKVESGPQTFSGSFKCHKCKTKFVAETEALECDGFKADPNTHWFDGSARSVLKFFVSCPGCGEALLADKKSVPYLVQRDVYQKCNDKNLKNGWGSLPPLLP